MIRKFAMAACMAFAGLGALAAPASAADACDGQNLCAGTIISRSNLDAALSKTWEGVALKDAIPERVQWMIKNNNFTLRLKKGDPLNLDPRLAEITKKYKGTASLDPSTGELKNYAAGTPFPDIDLADPSAGLKVLWNHHYAAQWGNGYSAPFAFLFVDGDKGLERVQTWIFSRQRVSHRYLGDRVSIGEADIFHKSLLFATAPQDVKGLGTYTISYNTGQLDDIWAYIRSVRRVRRLSGGAWVDAIGGTDFITDDLQLPNGFPTWFSSSKILGKRKILMVVDSMGDLGLDRKQRNSWRPNEKTVDAQYPLFRLSTPPYWNFEDAWQLRDTYVVELVPPAYHPYSKRIVYIDAQTWMGVLSDNYDKKGEYWKWVSLLLRAHPTADGYTDSQGNPTSFYFQAHVAGYDFQRRHATLVAIGESNLNNPTIDEKSFSYVDLEAAGR